MSTAGRVPLPSGRARRPIITVPSTSYSMLLVVTIAAKLSALATLRDMFSGLDRARQQFADRNPGSRQYYEEASRYLPGGHTRTVLTHPPFPLAFVSGQGATLTDVDGHTYVDLLGDYTAGLLGHSEHAGAGCGHHGLAPRTSVLEGFIRRGWACPF